ncbi:MAG: hypothetical protein PQJ59_06265 [Spirochaetales bacterium]|nr:hypothetical protein [Spirochaetales bacterium]
MKGVFTALTAFLAAIFLTSCIMGDIEEATFTFDNNMSLAIYITPNTGQDWSYFEVESGSETTVSSESNQLSFTAKTSGGQVLVLNGNYTYTSSTRTYLFEDTE